MDKLFKITVIFLNGKYIAEFLICSGGLSYGSTDHTNVKFARDKNIRFFMKDAIQEKEPEGLVRMRQKFLVIYSVRSDWEFSH